VIEREELLEYMHLLATAVDVVWIPDVVLPLQQPSLAKLI
jgi:hypothetical protein